ncbi:MAG: DMT family transporter [Candidatus Micrarchaeota archaeon]
MYCGDLLGKAFLGSLEVFNVMQTQTKGLWLVLFTGLVSGVSIFLNKFAVAGFDPFSFAFLKNVVVAVLLLAVLLFVFRKNAFSGLTRKNWFQLAVLGLVGGSVAFLVYFYALTQTSALNAGFLHKTLLFVFAVPLGALWLKEKLDKTFLAGAVLLLIGNFLVLSKFGGFNAADLLIVGAVALWAIENAYAKKVLSELSGLQVAFGRMFFGALFILVFLAATNNVPNVLAMPAVQWQWVGVTAGLLFLFVFSYYSGLKWVPVSKANALLCIGQVVTVLLSIVFLGRTIGALEAAGFLTLLAGVALVGYSVWIYPQRQKSGLAALA